MCPSHKRFEAGRSNQAKTFVSGDTSVNTCDTSQVTCRMRNKLVAKCSTLGD